MQNHEILDKKGWGIGAKIILIAMLCMILPMAVNYFYSNHVVSQSLNEATDEFLSSKALEKKNHIEMALKYQVEMTEMMANDTFTEEMFHEYYETKVLDPVKSDRISNILAERLNNANGLYENIIFLAHHGNENTIVIDSFYGKVVGTTFPNYEVAWGEEFFRDPKPGIGIAFPSPSTGRPVLLTAAPVLEKESGDIIAVFQHAIELSNLAGNIITNDNDETTKTILINSEGLVLASDNAEQIFNLNFSEESQEPGNNLHTFFQTLKNSASGVGMGYFTLDGTENIASFAKSDYLNMYVITFMPLDLALAGVGKIKASISILTVLSILLFAFIIIIFSRRTVSPINMAVSYLKLYAEGDFSEKVPEKHLKIKDETGVLLRSVNFIQEKIKEIITDINSSSIELAAASEKMLEVAQDSSAAMQEVSASTEEISASMEELSASVQQISAGSDQMDTAAAKLMDNMQNGKTIAQDIEEKAVKIEAEVINNQNRAFQVYTDLDNRLKEGIKKAEIVHEISNMANEIAGIAEQTNLLALNAAIEAARAGEQGRGFAVVAEEVRKLATNSTETVVNIQNLIEQVQGNIRNLIDDANELLSFMATDVDNDYKLFLEVAEQYKQDAHVFYDITDQAAQMGEEVLSSVKQVNDSINEVNKTIGHTAEQANQIAQGTQDTAQSMIDINQASENLRKMSDRLKELISWFNV
ncbi:MAG: methyl-accepting chemotaxis protein [Clostridia bacterium]|nr:methyl-accepting chemotaxis protein [Clostridia bacterium]